MSVMNFFGTVMKNFVSKPATKNYPSEPAKYPERTRGHIEISIDDCLVCGLCANNCPSGAIKVDRKAKTWSINRFDCVQCGYCTDVCPKKCLTIVPGYPEPQQGKAEEVHQKPVPESSGDVKPQNDKDKCVYCTLCAKKCPQGAITVDRANKTWTLDDEKCIGCGICSESCPKKSITMAEDNSSSADAKPQNDSDKCVYCTLCAKKCPQGAIAVDRANKTWTLDEEKCIGCGICGESCPKKSITMK